MPRLPFGGAMLALGAGGIATSPAAAQDDPRLSLAGDASSAGGSETTAERDTDYGDGSAFDTGGQLGYALLEGINYVAPTLVSDIQADFFQVAVRGPLRFDPRRGKLRARDWDELGDFFRIGQCVRLDWSASGRYEREHGHCMPWDVPTEDYYLSVRLGPIQDFTLGHGTVLRSYTNNVDPDHFHSGVVGNLQFHAFVQGQFFVDDVTRPSLLGASLALRPFSYASERTEWLYEYEHMLEIAVSVVSDLYAPAEVYTAFGRPLVDRAGNLLFRSRGVTVASAHLEYRFTFGSQVELEVRGDANYITGHGIGTHAQIWGIYNHPFGVYSVRGLGELRVQQPNYVPNYFDAYYGVQREQFTLSEGARRQLRAVTGGSDDDPFKTKQQLLEALDALGDAWQLGVLAGLDVQLYRGEGESRRTAVRGRLFLADNFERVADSQFFVSLEIPRLNDKIDVYALYARQNFDGLADLVALEDSLVKVSVRWDLNEQFYLTLNYGRIWQLVRDAEALVREGFRSDDEIGLALGFAEEL
ncbi:MAG: hypothetical protein RMK74_14440 [Myxococcales bacterium]|nr:hypothetical protein [Myxococcales bacterium]